MKELKQSVARERTRNQVISRTITSDPEPIENHEIENNIASIMENKRMSATILSHKSGVSANIIRGLADHQTKSIKFDVLEALANALSVDYDTLLGRKPYLRKDEIDEQIETAPIAFPKEIAYDVKGLLRAIGNGRGLHRILFHGPPGTGKTETAKLIAEITDVDLSIVQYEQMIDSHLGKTSKNILSFFEDINLYNKPLIVLIDEIDALALNRMQGNRDVQEMSRVTTTFMKGLDELNENITLIATTNRFDELDQALIRRFQSHIDFGRYDDDSLLEVGLFIYEQRFVDEEQQTSDVDTFTKLTENAIHDKHLTNPAEIERLLDNAFAYADEDPRSHLNHYKYFIRQFDQ